MSLAIPAEATFTVARLCATAGMVPRMAASVAADPEPISNARRPMRAMIPPSPSPTDAHIATL